MVDICVIIKFFCSGRPVCLPPLKEKEWVG